MHLTGRGGALGVTAVLALVCAALAGIEELYAVAAAALALLCLAFAAVALRRLGLVSERAVLPALVAAGESAAVELTVTNGARRRSPTTSLRDPFDGGRDLAAFTLAPLRPGEGLSTSYLLPPSPRGRYLVGPLELGTVDPFGLIRRSSLGAAASPLVVHPRLLHVDSPARPQGFDRFGAGRRGAFEPEGDEFAALRPYRAGDDLRHVHWPSTARMEQVMVRQTDAAAEPRSAVAVDLRAGMWDPAWLEEALSAAGGVLESAHRAGMEVRLITTPSGAHGALDTGFGRSGAHWSRVLETLAVAEASPADPVSAPLAGLLGAAGPDRSGNDTLIVVTSAACSEPDLRGLGRLAPEDSLIVAVFGAPRPLDRLHVAGRLVQLDELGTFPAAWDRLQLRPGGMRAR